MSQKLFLLVYLFTGALWAQASATSSHFVSVPVTVDMPSRASINFAFTPSPSGEVEVTYVHQLGSGFDTGIGLHAGLLGIKNYGILGGDFLFRFLSPVNEVTFLGVQAQAGYVFTGLGNVPISDSDASALPITTGIVIGGVVRDLTRFYFFPAAEFGQTRNDGDKFWKSGIGLRFTLGTAVSLSDTTYLVIETRPRIANLVGSSSALSTFTIDAMLALLFDF
jgi:hypothetical protein